MGSSAKIRIILDIFIFISIALLPWWFSLSLLIVGFFKFDIFYEGFIFGLAMDSVYGISRNVFFKEYFISIITLIILFIIINQLKKRLRL